MRKTTAELFFSIPLFCLPLYLVQCSLFNIPTNLLDIILAIAIILNIQDFKGSSFLFFHKKNTLLFWGILLLILGISVPIALQKFTPHSYGILKSWIILPAIYATLFFKKLRSVSDIDRYLKIFLYSSATVASISLFLYAFGNLTYDHRLTGIYNSPNYLAMYVAPGLLIALYFSIKHTQKKRAFYLFLCALLLLTLFFTHSASTMLAIIISVFIFFLFLQRKHPLLRYMPPAALILLILVAHMLINKGFMLEKSSFSSRITIWKVSSDLLKEHFLFGIGPGNFQEAYLAKQPLFAPYEEWAVPHPHNTFLAFWLYAGLFGLAGFLLILIAAIINILLAIKKERQILLSSLLLSYFCYFILHSFSDTLFWKNDLAIVYCIFVAMAISLSTKRVSEH